MLYNCSQGHGCPGNERLKTLVQTSCCLSHFIAPLMTVGSKQPSACWFGHLTPNLLPHVASLQARRWPTRHIPSLTAIPSCKPVNNHRDNNRKYEPHLFDKRGNGSTESLDNLLKVTLLVSGRARTLNTAVWLRSPHLEHGTTVPSPPTP